MRVLLDLDSIIVNLQDEWYRRNNQRFNDTLTPEQVTAWDIAQFSKGGERVYKILHEPGLFAGLPPLPGAQEGVNRLLDQGHEVFIVSAAVSAAARSEKPEWVKKHLPRIGIRNVILTPSKYVVKGDVLFDDSPDNLLAYRSEWPLAFLATIEYPYNALFCELLRPMDDLFFVAGHYRDTQAAWRAFTDYVQRMS